jgi:D-tyrosyl-tRNA(Tyr) deacylase
MESSLSIHFACIGEGMNYWDYHIASTSLTRSQKGNKPDFHQSASGDKARSLYQTFYKKVGELYEFDKVKDGVFAAMMDVALINDGPVSFLLVSLSFFGGG